MSLFKRYFPKELHDVLKALEGRKTTTTMEISEVAGVSHSFLLIIIPLLEDKGFVSVVKGTEDKRKKFINLTDGGRFLLDILESYRATLQGNIPLAKAMMKQLAVFVTEKGL